ncbi:MAG: dihydrolipoyl dehydrogenase [Candidatus Lambdaproteobacteria bacterium]|nr:dihydrolipoyl dehydrogenase [Candidatus Lambdaproteobacteria bacterium]
MSERVDVAVIGSGPGGYVAAIKAAQRGLKAVVIEKERLGGVCLNWGCIPTKALLRNAELYETLQDAEALGLTLGKLGFVPGRIVERSRGVAERMSKGVAALLKKYKVRHLQGTARFLGAQSLQVEGEGGKTQVLQATDTIVATGARPRALPAIPVDGKTAITYREALALTTFPKRLLIVGAGAIGVEFAYYFNAFGVEVHLVELLPHLLPQEDAEIAELLLKSFRRRGIRCYPATGVKECKLRKGRVEALLEGKGDPVRLECDQVLVAVGMEAQVEGLGLDALGAVLERGYLKTDGAMRTSVPHLYAIGDVAGHQLLAHKASAEAEVAVAALAGHPVAPLDYGQIPACTYCQPQVASLGLSEAQCKEQGLAVKVGRFPFLASGKAQAIGHPEGLIKLVFGEPHGRLLGAHLIGPDVTELVAELGLALRLEATAEEILATVHAHPTLSEAVFEAAGVAYGLSANY